MNIECPCSICGRVVAIGDTYVVRIDVFADPSVAPVTTDAMDLIDDASQLPALLAELEKFSAQELEDQVFKRFEYRLCMMCRAEIMKNPLGLPRGKRVEGNN